MAETYSQHYNESLFALRQQEAGPTGLVMVPRIKSGAASCEPSQQIKILRLPEVMDRVGICRALIYRRMISGTFPKQIALGPRAVGWLEHEIDAWLMARVQQSRAAAQT
jgi:prophage regulatory protein